MIRIHKEEGVLMIDYAPWSMRLIFTAFILVGLVFLYHFSLSGRIECRRAGLDGTCTLYRSSVFDTETHTFPLRDLSEALTVVEGPKSATRVDLILNGKALEFSRRKSDHARAKQLADQINEFIELDEMKKLDAKQKPDVVTLFLGLLLSGVGLVTLLSIGHSTQMRLDASSDKLRIWRGFPARKLQEFKLSELDHLDIKRESLLLVFQDGTFHKFDVFSKSEINKLKAEITPFLEQHISKEEPGDWA